MSEHWVDFVRDGEGSVTLAFTCRGQEASACHIYPECGCEFWDNDHEHPSLPHANCWLTDWFSNHDEGGASYHGADAEEGGNSSYPPITKSGFIATIFADEWVEWEWAA